MEGGVERIGMKKTIMKVENVHKPGTG